MTNRRFILFTSFLLLSVSVTKAQDNGSYKTPPKDIADMLLAKPTPNVSADDKGKWMLLSEVSLCPSVEELARPELKIAGLRINPFNFAPSRQNYISNFYLKNLSTGKEYKISGLPSPLFAGNVNWSPDDKKIAFTQITKDRIDLYVIDVAAQKATKVNKTALNTVIGGGSSGTMIIQYYIEPLLSRLLLPLQNR
jgi:dipeptidyl aminopeptidase/acylaminoacyl peptidase